jgi:hypothetical protein
LYHSSNNIQSAASVDVPGFGEPRKSACVVFYLCLLSVQYAQQPQMAIPSPFSPDKFDPRNGNIIGKL